MSRNHARADFPALGNQLLSNPIDPAIAQSWIDLYHLVISTLIGFHAIRPQDREDLVQDVLLTLHSSGKPPESIRGLAVWIAVRAGNNWLRKINRPSCRCREPWCVKITETVPSRELNDLGIAIREAMALMADDTRQVFDAVFLQGMELRTAAKRLSLTLHAVRRLCAEARRFLQALWGIDTTAIFPRKRAPGVCLAHFYSCQPEKALRRADRV